MGNVKDITQYGYILYYLWDSIAACFIHWDTGSALSLSDVINTKIKKPV